MPLGIPCPEVGVFGRWALCVEEGGVGSVKAVNHRGRASELVRITNMLHAPPTAARLDRLPSPARGHC